MIKKLKLVQVQGPGFMVLSTLMGICLLPWKRSTLSGSLFSINYAILYGKLTLWVRTKEHETE